MSLSVESVDRKIVLLAGLAIAGFGAASSVVSLLGAGGALTLAVRAMVAALATIVLLENLLGLRPSYRGLALLPILVLWLLMLARIVSDVGVTFAPLPREELHYIGITLGACFLPAAALLFANSRATWVGVWKLALVLSSCTTLILGYLALSGSVANWAGRLATEILNPISVGHVGVTLTALVLGAPRTAHSGGPLSALLGTGLLAAGALLVFASLSRGPLVTLVGIYAAALVFRPGRFPAGVRLGAIATVVVLGFFAVKQVAPTLLHSINLLEAAGGVRLTLDDQSTSYRVVVIGDALRGFAESPLLGASLAEECSGDYPHNFFVESLLATGLVGFVCLAVIVAVGAHAAFNLVRRSAFAAWAGLLFLQALIASLVSGSLFLSDGFWVSLALILSAGQTLELETPRSAGTPGDENTSLAAATGRRP